MTVSAEPQRSASGASGGTPANRVTKPSPLKEEEKKSGAPISKNWRPDPDSERLGKKVFGDRYEAELADHIDYCLKTDFHCHDHDANWRRRGRAIQRNPQLRLELRPQARQLGVVEVIPPSKSRDGWGRRCNRSIADAPDELIAYARQREPPVEAVERRAEETIRACENAPGLASSEHKARVQESLERFRRGQSKEASG